MFEKVNLTEVLTVLITTIGTVVSGYFAVNARRRAVQAYGHAKRAKRSADVAVQASLRPKESDSEHPWEDDDFNENG